MTLRDDLWREDKRYAILFDNLLRPITTATNLVATVGTANTAVLPETIGRKTAVLVNDSNNKIYLRLGNVATTGMGVTLMPNGGAYEINWQNMFTGTISAMNNTGWSPLSVMEGW